MADYQILTGDWIEQLKTLPPESVQCVVTSPPYWGLRDYGVAGQLGLEKTPEEYVERLVTGFHEVKRVLRKDGTLWLNLGDSYSGGGRGFGYGGKQDTNKGCEDMPRSIVADGLKPKDLVGIPWRVAFALQSDGWYLRQDIIWAKPNPMPESVTDRCTKSHEYIFLLTKSAKYFYDAEAIEEIALGFDERKDTRMKGSEKYADGDYLQLGNANSLSVKGRERWRFKGTGTFGNRGGELDGLHSGKNYKPRFKNLEFDGQQPNTFHIKRANGESDDVYPIRNKRSVWTVNTTPYKEAHFATFPPEIPRLCILAGSKEGDTIFDPFCGSGTTGEVALKLNRNFIGIELNQNYVNNLIIPRLDNVDPLFAVPNVGNEREK